MKTAVALLLGFSIGALCRTFDIPVPSPPKLIGALLVLSITVGYLTADHLLGPPAPPAASNPP